MQPWRGFYSGLRGVTRLDLFDALRELLDPAVRGVELGRADAVELLAALPERDRLVEARVAAFEPLDDRLQLASGPPRSVGSLTASPRPGRRTSRCRARRRPSRRRRPGRSSGRSRPPMRTIAYPRSSVERGERARSLPGRSARARPAVARASASAPAGDGRARRRAVAARARGRARAPRERAARERSSRALSSARSGTTSRAAAVGVEARASATRSESGVSCS